MRPLNIWIIPSWYPSEMDPNGVPFIRAQAQALAKAGHNVTVIFTQAYSLKMVWRYKKMRWHISNKNIDGVREFHSYRPKTHLHFIDEATRLRLGKRILRKLTRQNGKPDLLHLHVFLAGELAIWYSKLYQVPLVTTEHYTGFSRGIVKPWQMRLARKLYCYSNEVITVGESLRRTLKQYCQTDTQVIPNLVDIHRFKPSSEKLEPNMDKPYTFAFVGSLHGKKNPALLLKAFQLHIKIYPDSRLLFIGEGELSSSLQKMVEHYRLGDKVNFLGFLQPPDVAEALKSADCLVLPSRYETFGIVVIEAMAIGLPVIVTRSGGPEFFVTETTGIVVDHTPESLSAAMEKVQKTDWDSNTIRKYVDDNFSSEIIVKRLTDLYNSLLDHPEVLQASRELSLSGGISKVACQLAEGLRKKGYRVSTLTLEQDPSLEKKDLGRVIRFTTPGWFSILPPYLNKYLRTRWFTRKVHQIFKVKNRDPHTITISHRDSFGADIAIGHSCHKEALKVKKKSGLGLWILNPMHPFYLKQERRIFQKPYSRLAAISRSIAEEYMRYYGIPEDRVRIIPNGVDTLTFNPDRKIQCSQEIRKQLNIPDNVKLLLFVGNEFKRKGLEILINSLTKIPEGIPVHLCVLGEADPQPFQRQCQEKGLEDRVHFLGRREDAPLFFSAADLFVLPVNYEPFGLVGIEAMSSGTPVLATETGGIIDYLVSGKNGFFIKRDAEDLAEKISLLLQDRDLWAYCSRGARKKALEYNWDAIIDQYANWIEEIFVEKGEP